MAHYDSSGNWVLDVGDDFNNPPAPPAGPPPFANQSDLLNIAGDKANTLGYQSVSSALLQGVDPTALGLPSGINADYVSKMAGATNYSPYADQNNPSSTINSNTVTRDDSGNVVNNLFTYGGPEMPANYPGGFGAWVQHLYETGQAGQDYNGGGFTNWIRTHGYAVPLAAGAAFGGLAAMGAGAAEAGAGAGAAEAAGNATTPNAYMASAGLDAGTGFTPGYASMGDYMSQAGLDAGTFSGAGFQMPSALSAKDALTYANRAKSIASLFNNMGSSKSGYSPQQMATALGTSTSNNDFIGQIKANQNPFLFTPAGQTIASEGMYDVSGSNLANALRRKA